MFTISRLCILVYVYFDASTILLWATLFCDIIWNQTCVITNFVFSQTCLAMRNTLCSHKNFKICPSFYSCVNAYVCISHLYMGFQRAEKSIGFPETKVTEFMSSLIWVLQTESFARITVALTLQSNYPALDFSLQRYYAFHGDYFGSGITAWGSMYV